MTDKPKRPEAIHGERVVGWVNHTQEGNQYAVTVEGRCLHRPSDERRWAWGETYWIPAPAVATVASQLRAAEERAEKAEAEVDAIAEALGDHRNVYNPGDDDPCGQLSSVEAIRCVLGALAAEPEKYIPGGKPERPTVRGIVAAWLREHGWEGLCNDEFDCGCGVDDLAPGDCMHERDCQPAKRGECTKHYAPGCFYSADGMCPECAEESTDGDIDTMTLRTTRDTLAAENNKFRAAAYALVEWARNTAGPIDEVTAMDAALAATDTPTGEEG